MKDGYPNIAILYDTLNSNTKIRMKKYKNMLNIKRLKDIQCNEQYRHNWCKG